MGSSSTRSTRIVALSVGPGTPSVLCGTLYLSFTRGADRRDGGLDDPSTIMMKYDETAPDRLDTFAHADEPHAGAERTVRLGHLARVVEEQGPGLDVGPLDHHGARRTRAGVLGHVRRALLDDAHESGADGEGQGEVDVVLDVH